jgi:hypothetical protein
MNGHGGVQFSITELEDVREVENVHPRARKYLAAVGGLY